MDEEHAHRLEECKKFLNSFNSNDFLLKFPSIWTYLSDPWSVIRKECVNLFAKSIPHLTSTDLTYLIDFLKSKIEDDNSIFNEQNSNTVKPQNDKNSLKISSLSIDVNSTNNSTSSAAVTIIQTPWQEIHGALLTFEVLLNKLNKQDSNFLILKCYRFLSSIRIPIRDISKNLISQLFLIKNDKKKLNFLLLLLNELRKLETPLVNPVSTFSPNSSATTSATTSGNASANSSRLSSKQILKFDGLLLCLYDLLNLIIKNKINYLLNYHTIKKILFLLNNFININASTIRLKIVNIINLFYNYFLNNLFYIQEENDSKIKNSYIKNLNLIFLLLLNNLNKNLIVDDWKVHETNIILSDEIFKNTIVIYLKLISQPNFYFNYIDSDKSIESTDLPENFKSKSEEFVTFSDSESDNELFLSSKIDEIEISETENELNESFSDSNSINDDENDLNLDTKEIELEFELKTLEKHLKTSLSSNLDNLTPTDSTLKLNKDDYKFNLNSFLKHNFFYYLSILANFLQSNLKLWICHTRFEVRRSSLQFLPTLSRSMLVLPLSCCLTFSCKKLNSINSISSFFSIPTSNNFYYTSNNDSFYQNNFTSNLSSPPSSNSFDINDEIILEEFNEENLLNFLTSIIWINNLIKENRHIIEILLEVYGENTFIQNSVISEDFIESLSSHFSKEEDNIKCEDSLFNFSNREKPIEKWSREVYGRLLENELREEFYDFINKLCINNKISESDFNKILYYVEKEDNQEIINIDNQNHYQNSENCIDKEEFSKILGENYFSFWIFFKYSMNSSRILLEINNFFNKFFNLLYKLNNMKKNRELNKLEKISPIFLLSIDWIELFSLTNNFILIFLRKRPWYNAKFLVLSNSLDTFFSHLYTNKLKSIYKHNSYDQFNTLTGFNISISKSSSCSSYDFQETLREKREREIENQKSNKIITINKLFLYCVDNFYFNILLLLKKIKKISNFWFTVTAIVQYNAQRLPITFNFLYFILSAYNTPLSSNSNDGDESRSQNSIKSTKTIYSRSYYLHPTLQYQDDEFTIEGVRLLPSLTDPFTNPLLYFQENSLGETKIATPSQSHFFSPNSSGTFAPFSPNNTKNSSNSTIFSPASNNSNGASFSPFSSPISPKYSCNTPNPLGPDSSVVLPRVSYNIMNQWICESISSYNLYYFYENFYLYNASDLHDNVVYDRFKNETNNDLKNDLMKLIEEDSDSDDVIQENDYSKLLMVNNESQHLVNYYHYLLRHIKNNRKTSYNLYFSIIILTWIYECLNNPLWLDNRRYCKKNLYESLYNLVNYSILSYEDYYDINSAEINSLSSLNNSVDKIHVNNKKLCKVYDTYDENFIKCCLSNYDLHYDSKNDNLFFADIQNFNAVVNLSFFFFNITCLNCNIFLKSQSNIKFNNLYQLFSYNYYQFLKNNYFHENSPQNTTLHYTKYIELLASNYWKDILIKYMSKNTNSSTSSSTLLNDNSESDEEVFIIVNDLRLITNLLKSLNLMLKKLERFSIYILTSNIKRENLKFNLISNSFDINFLLLSLVNIINILIDFYKKIENDERENENDNKALSSSLHSTNPNSNPNNSNDSLSENNDEFSDWDEDSDDNMSTTNSTNAFFSTTGVNQIVVSTKSFSHITSPIKNSQAHNLLSNDLISMKVILNNLSSFFLNIING